MEFRFHNAFALRSTSLHNETMQKTSDGVQLCLSRILRSHTGAQWPLHMPTLCLPTRHKMERMCNPSIGRCRRTMPLLQNCCFFPFGLVVSSRLLFLDLDGVAGLGSFVGKLFGDYQNEGHSPKRDETYHSLRFWTSQQPSQQYAHNTGDAPE